MSETRNDGLDDRIDATVAHSETFACHTAYENLAARRTVERDVADDHVLLGRECSRPIWEDGQTPAREAFTEVVVSITLESERHATRQERAEALPGGAFEVN